MEFQLPSEAQWEYACRAGTTGELSVDLDEVAWYQHNSKGRTQGVGGKKPNDWGLYDMLGNVWEWCADRYDPEYYHRSPVQDPAGPKKGVGRVCRGGSWQDAKCHVRATQRRYWGFKPRLDNLGFRVMKKG